MSSRSDITETLPTSPTNQSDQSVPPDPGCPATFATHVLPRLGLQRVLRQLHQFAEGRGCRVAARSASTLRSSAHWAALSPSMKRL